MAIYLDVLSFSRCQSLGLQQELHDPVKAVCRIQEFTQTMAKLKLLIDKSFDSPKTLLTNFNKHLSNIVERNNDYFYAGIMLVRFETIRASVCNHYTQTITKIKSVMEERFDNLQISYFQTFGAISGCFNLANRCNTFWGRSHSRNSKIF